MGMGKGWKLWNSREDEEKWDCKEENEKGDVNGME